MITLKNKLLASIYMAIFMHVVAMAYLLTVHLNVVMVHKIKWNSNIGMTMLIVPMVTIVYAWLMVLVSYLSDLSIVTKPKVIENEGDWKAKDVHWTDIHLKVYGE